VTHSHCDARPTVTFSAVQHCRFHPTEHRRLSWPKWLVIYRGGVTALQRDLDNAALWAQKWQMEFNVKKCKVIMFGDRLIVASTTWEELS